MNKIILLILFSFIICNLSKSQSQVCPNNISFEDGTLTSWNAFIGEFNGSGSSTKKTQYPSTLAAPTGTIGVSNLNEYYGKNGGSTAVQPGIRIITSNSIDTFGGFSTIPNINGYQYTNSVVLGSTTVYASSNKGLIRGVSYTIGVPQGSTSLPYFMTYAYAMVLENGSHMNNQQPLAKATLSKPDGTIITCASPSYYLPTLGSGSVLDTATALQQGFTLSSKLSNTGVSGNTKRVWYKPWTEVTFDLAPYRGQTVILTFEADNCVPGGHFAYAYFALRNECGGLDISGPQTVCSNSSVTYSYTVPTLPNLVSIQWSYPANWQVKDSSNYLYINPNNQSGTIQVTQTNSCNTSTSSLNVSLYTPSAAGTISGGDSVCSGNNSSTLHLSGYNGSVTKWIYSSDSVSWNDIVSTANSINATNLTNSTLYKAIVQNTAFCPADTSAVATVHVVMPPIAGTILGNDSVCSGNNSSTLHLNGYNGSVTKWIYSTDSSTWNDIASVTNSINVNNLINSTYYKAIVENTSYCPLDTSAVATVHVVTPPVAGNISGGDSVCSGNNSSTLHLNGYNGSVTKWIYSTDSVSWDDIVSTANSINATNLTSSTQYKAIVKNTSYCPADTSAVATVHVIAPPVAGTILGSDSVCSGTSSTLHLSGYNGSVTKWMYSTDSSTWNNIASVTNSINVNNLINSTYYKAIVENTSYCPLDTSAVATVHVIAPPVAGTILGSDSVCSGNNSSTLRLNGYTGSIAKWVYSTNGTVWNDIISSANLIKATNLTNSTLYKAIVQNTSYCPADTSAVATVHVVAPPVAGIILGSDSVCSGINSSTLHLNGYAGSVVKWMYSTNGVTWNNIASSANSINATNLTNSTQYKAVVQNTSYCPADTSAVATVHVVAPPVAGTILGSDSVCSGNNSSTLRLNGYTGSIAKWVYSTNGITWNNIASSANSINATNLTNSTQYKAIVKNTSYCPLDTSGVAFIHVSTKSIAGNISPDDVRLCLNQNRNNLLTLSNHYGTILNWQYSYDGQSWKNISPKNSDSVQIAGANNSTTRYRVIVKNEACPADTSNIARIAIYNSPYPEGSISPKDTAICYGDSVKLRVNSTNATLYTWQNYTSLIDYNNGIISFPLSFFTAIAKPQQTSRYVVAFQSGTCPNILYDTSVVKVYQKIDLTVTNDTAIVLNQPIQLDATSNVNDQLDYVWTPSTGLSNPYVSNPVVTAGLSGGDTITYKVRATNSIGCYAENSVRISVFSTSLADIYVPSGYTPNGDGVNDIVHAIPVGIKDFEFFSIYNRYGQLIFTTHDPGIGWDGNFNGGKQPSGTYVYMAKGIDYQGRMIFKKGTLVLIR